MNKIIVKYKVPQNNGSIKWRVVPGFSRYAASNHQNPQIMDLKSNRILHPCKMTGCGNNTYDYVTVTGDDGRIRGIGIHRLVALAWIKNPKNLPCVDHINSIPGDNRISNLRWISHSDNHRKPEARLKASISQQLRRMREKAVKEQMNEGVV